LRPLLRTRDGEKIRTRQGWDKARQELREAWLKHLGPSPEKPAKLDVRVEETDPLNGYTRQLVSFASEGDDRIRAYLLVPDGLRPTERRPAVVVLHQTNARTLKEPGGLDKKNPELALALDLVERGYITLSPECYILKAPDSEREDGDNINWAARQANVLKKRRTDWTGMGKLTFDASRCIDLLETLPN